LREAFKTITPGFFPLPYPKCRPNKKPGLLWQKKKEKENARRRGTIFTS